MRTSERFEQRHGAVIPCLFVFLSLFTAFLASPEAHAQSARVIPENIAQVQLSFAPVVAQVVPSVVNVYARRSFSVGAGCLMIRFFSNFSAMILPRRANAPSNHLAPV